MEKTIRSQLGEYLKEYRKKTITLDELSSLFGGEVSYSEFADAVTEFMDSNVLLPIKSAGFSSRTPRLPHKYKINSSIMLEEYKCDIERMAIALHKKINLEYYFFQPQSVWEADRENILKLDRYLLTSGLPEYPAGAPERSYQIFGDEKFIDEKQGRRLLHRLRLYEEMRISTGFDPAMFFVNAKKFNSGQNVHKHLIIENRTPFYALSEILGGSALTTLIYGAGFNILSSVTMFEKQIDLPGVKHKYFYFGDLDYTGISIWYYLFEKVNAEPALFFYKALLEREAAYGKEYQQPNPTALNHFLKYFDTEEGERIQTILASGKYYPQEALWRQELQDVFFGCFEKDGNGN